MNMSKPTAVENLSTTPIRTIELSKKVDLINLIPDLPADQVFSWVRNNQGIQSRNRGMGNKHQRKLLWN